MGIPAIIADNIPARQREEEVMQLLARIVTGGTAAMPDRDEDPLRQMGYAAHLVRGCLDDPEDNLGAAVRLATEALKGKTAATAEFRDPVQAKWGAPKHLDAAKLRLETPLLLPRQRRRAGREIRMAAQRALPAELTGHLSALSRRLGPLAEPLQAWLAGGFAVHYHTQHRMPYNADIKWSHKIPIPPDMQVFEISATGSAGITHVVVMGGGFSDVLGSFPPDWEERSREAHRFGDIVLHVMDPVDLAVSKVARSDPRDQEDIRELAERGLVDPELFARRAEEAISHYVGDLTFVRHNLADAVEIVSAAAHRHVETGAACRSEPNGPKDSDDESAAPDPYAIPDQPEPPRGR